jgi:hypothetical protein
MDDKEARLLPLRLDLRVISTTGFDWGVQRSEFKRLSEPARVGPAHVGPTQVGKGLGAEQLALALLADVLDENQAIALYKVFHQEVVAHLADERWSMTDEEIRSQALLRSTAGQ